MLFRLAVRNLLRHRRRTTVTLLAIAVGVTAVVTVRGLLDGLQGTLIDGVVAGGTGALQIHKKGWAESLDASPFAFLIDDADAVAAAAVAVEGVVAAAPRLSFPGLVSVGDGMVANRPHRLARGDRRRQGTRGRLPRVPQRGNASRSSTVTFNPGRTVEPTLPETMMRGSPKRSPMVS